MNLLIEYLADHLAAQGIGAVGVDIFLSKLPASPDEAVAVVDNGGTSYVQTGVNKYRIQTIVRNGNYSNGAEKAKEIFEEMDDEWITITDGTKVYLRAVDLPAYLGCEENGLHMWSTNFRVTRNT